MDVGFIGLGLMGRAMARNIAASGQIVRAWNRSQTDAPTGVELVASVEKAFDSDVIFTMLSDDDAIRAVILRSGILEKARPGAVHIVTSTISVAFAEELSEAHRQVGLGYVSAPVFGRPDVAEAAQLNIMAAGASEAIAKIQPLLDLIGRRTWVIGDDPKQANAAKIAGNMMIAMAIEAMAEAVVLTDASGVAKEAFFELITQTLFAGRAYENYSGKIAKGDYEQGFRMTLGFKDLRLAAAAADAAGRTLPMLDAVHRQMNAAMDAGLGDKDWSAMAEYTIGKG